MTTLSERFKFAADRLAIAGDRFRGKGRVVYEEPAGFRVEYEVDAGAHRKREIDEWIAMHVFESALPGATGAWHRAEGWVAALTFQIVWREIR